MATCVGVGGLERVLRKQDLLVHDHTRQRNPGEGMMINTRRLEVREWNIKSRFHSPHIR